MIPDCSCRPLQLVLAQMVLMMILASSSSSFEPSSTVSFVPAVARQEPTCRKPKSPLHSQEVLVAPLYLARPTTTTTTTSMWDNDKRSSSRSTQTAASQLVSLLIEESRSKMDSSPQIEELVQQLVAARVSFDPAACLNDNVLYKSRVIAGPKPFWEQLGFLAPWSNNLQGQQYNFDDRTVINYAEIFGKGTFQWNIL